MSRYQAFDTYPRFISCLESWDDKMWQTSSCGKGVENRAGITSSNWILIGSFGELLISLSKKTEFLNLDSRSLDSCSWLIFSSCIAEIEVNMTHEIASEKRFCFIVNILSGCVVTSAFVFILCWRINNLTADVLAKPKKWLWSFYYKPSRFNFIWIKLVD